MARIDPRFRGQRLRGAGESVGSEVLVDNLPDDGEVCGVEGELLIFCLPLAIRPWNHMPPPPPFRHGASCLTLLLNRYPASDRWALCTIGPFFLCCPLRGENTLRPRISRVLSSSVSALERRNQPTLICWQPTSLPISNFIRDTYTLAFIHGLLLVLFSCHGLPQGVLSAER